MENYSVSVVERVPQSSGTPSLTELGPIVASGLSWTEELGREGEATASTLPETLSPEIVTTVQELLDDDDDVPGLELWVRRGASLVFAGPIVGLQVQGDTWSFRAAGLLYYLRYMYLRQNYAFSGTDQFTIAKSLIDDWQALLYGHFGLDTSGISTSGVTRDRTYDAGDNAYQRLVELAEVNNGFDVWVDADRDVHLGTKGSDLSSTVVLDRRGITNAGLSISLAAGDVASEAWGMSTDENPLVQELTNSTLRQSFGRSGISASFDGVVVQATLDDHTQALLDARSRPLISPQPDLIPVEGAGVEDFAAGDIVQFTPRIGIPLTMSRRVVSKRVSVSDEGVETIGVSFG